MNRERLDQLNEISRQAFISIHKQCSLSEIMGVLENICCVALCGVVHEKKGPEKAEKLREEILKKPVISTYLKNYLTNLQEKENDPTKKSGT